MSAWGPPPVVGRSGHRAAGARIARVGQNPQLPDALTGRDRELDEIRRLLATYVPRGARRPAADRRGRDRQDGAPRTPRGRWPTASACLTASGIESESALAHAGLLELLTPLRALLPAGPGGPGRGAGLRAGLGVERRTCRPLPGGGRHPLAAGGGLRRGAGAGARRRPPVAGPRVRRCHRVRRAPPRGRCRRVPDERAHGLRRRPLPTSRGALPTLAVHALAPVGRGGPRGERR